MDKTYNEGIGRRDGVKAQVESSKLCVHSRIQNPVQVKFHIFFPVAVLDHYVLSIFLQIICHDPVILLQRCLKYYIIHDSSLLFQLHTRHLQS